MLKSFMPLNKKMRLFAVFVVAGNKYLSDIYSKGFCGTGQGRQTAIKTKAVIF